MKSFDYIAPQSLSDVTTLLRRYGTKARLLAGGTDLLLRLERRLVEPSVVIDLKMINDRNFFFDVQPPRTQNSPLTTPRQPAFRSASSHQRKQLARPEDKDGHLSAIGVRGF